MRASTFFIAFGAVGLALSLYLAWINWSDYHAHDAARPFREGDLEALLWTSAYWTGWWVIVIAAAIAWRRSSNQQSQHPAGLGDR